MIETKKENFKGVELYTRKRSLNDYISLLKILPDPDPVLREKGVDISFYRQIRNDSHLLSCLIKREAGIFSHEYEIIPATTTRTDRKIADFVKDVFSNLKIENIRYDVLYTFYFGFSVLEKNYISDGLYIVYEKIEGKPQEWFIFDGENNLCFKSKDSPQGEIVDMDKVILVQEAPEYNNPYGRRVASSVFWPVTFKRGGMQFWLEFIEKYGGVLMYLLTHEKDEVRKRQKLNMLDDMVRTAVGVYETGDELKIVDVNKTGSSDTFLAMLNFMNAEISKAVVGQTLTTEQGERGARSLGEVHFEVQNEIIEKDIKREIWVFNKIIRELVALNFDTTVFPQYAVERDYLKDEKAKRDSELKNQGVIFKKSYFIKNYGFDEEDIDVIQPDLPFQPQEFSEGIKKKRVEEISFAENDIEKFIEEDKAVEKLYKDTLNDFKGIFEGLFKRLKEVISASEDYEEAIEKVLKTVEIDEGYRTEVSKVAEAFVEADLLGRLAAKEQMLTTEKTKEFSEDEIEFLKKKLVMKKELFDQLPEKYKKYAFTVAGMETEAQIESVLQSIVEARENGRGFKDWKKSMLEKGFKVNDIVYWQNVRSAQAAGKYQEMMEDAKEGVAEYWQYVAVMDKSTRPAHAALNGLIRRYDDPFWNTNYPPNGYYCRCTVRSLSKEYLKAHGYDINKIGTGMPDWNEITTNNKDNEIFNTQISQKLNQFDKDGKLYLKPDPGFENNVGRDLYKWIENKNIEILDKEWISLIDEKVDIINELKNVKGITKEYFNGSKEEAVESLKNIFSKGALIDKKGLIVYLGDNEINRLINHLFNKEKERLKYISFIKDIVEDPDLILFDIVEAANKLKIAGKIKIGRIYVKKINEKNIAFVTNYTSEFPRFTGWSLYSKNEQKGVIVYKKKE